MGFNFCGQEANGFTVNVERFAELNIYGFSTMKFSREYFCGALASGVF